MVSGKISNSKFSLSFKFLGFALVIFSLWTLLVIDTGKAINQESKVQRWLLKNAFAEDASESRRYYSPDGYSIIPPPAWRVNDGEKWRALGVSAMFIGPVIDKATEMKFKFFIKIASDPNYSVREYNKELKRVFSKKYFNRLTSFSIQEKQLGKVSWQEISFQGIRDGGQLEFKVLHTFREGRVFLINVYTKVGDYLINTKELYNSIKSFQFQN